MTSKQIVETIFEPIFTDQKEKKLCELIQQSKVYEDYDPLDRGFSLFIYKAHSYYLLVDHEKFLYKYIFINLYKDKDNKICYTVEYDNQVLNRVNKTTHNFKIESYNTSYRSYSLRCDNCGTEITVYDNEYHHKQVKLNQRFVYDCNQVKLLDL